MKSFSQFLQESYLNEAGVPDDYEEYMRKYSGTPKKLAQMSDADFNSRFGNNPKMNIARDIGKEQQGSLFTRKGKPQDFRNPNRTPFTATDPIKQGQRSPLPDTPQSSPSSPGQLEIPQGKTTKVKSPARGGDIVPYSAPPKPTKPASAQSAPPKPAAIVKASPSTPTRAPIQQIRTNLNVPTPSNLPSKPKQLALPAAGQTSASKPQASTGKPPVGPKIKVPSGLAKAGRVAGKVLGPAAAALDVADEKSKGSGWARSLAKGAVVAAGGALGGAAGSVAGPVGSIGGATAGSMAASKAFDVAAGANAKERAAMATANRQRQAGTAIKGIGGKTTFDTKKNTMTTGTGSQRKTVGLAKTGVVQRGGQSVAGHLAYKGGKAVYKAGPSAQSLAKTSSNPLERVGRTLFAGAYKKHDAAKAQQALTKARQSDMARQKALGVKALPGK